MTARENPVLPAATVAVPLKNWSISSVGIGGSVGVLATIAAFFIFDLLGMGTPDRFQSGEVMLLPHNDPHLMGSDLAMVPVQAGELVRRWSDGRLNTM